MKRPDNVDFLRNNGWVRIFSGGENYFRDPQNIYTFHKLNDALNIECRRQQDRKKNSTLSFSLGEIMVTKNSSKGKSEKFNPALITSPTIKAKEPTGKSEVRTEIVEVTPDFAAKLLEQNKLNRNLSEQVVKNYAYQMLRGQWQLNGDTIKVGEDGSLYDGQHRLWAVVMSKATVKMIIAYGVEEKARPTIDKGRRRSMGDEFHMFLGISNGPKIVAMIRIFSYIDTGKPPIYLSYDDCVDIYSKNKDAFDYMHQNFNTGRIFDNAVIVGSFVFALSQKPECAESIKEFARLVQSGENISKENPAYTLRNSVLIAKSKGGTSGFQTSEARYRFSLKVLRAIQAYLTNESIKKNLYSTVAGLHFFKPKCPVATCLDVDPTTHKMKKVYNKSITNGVVENQD